MILDDVKDRFVIVARQGNSIDYPPNSPRALASAFPDADLIHADVTACQNGVLICSNKSSVSKMSLEEAEDADLLPLRYLLNWAKETGKGLLLEPCSTDAALSQRIAGDARFFGMEDRIAVVARSLKQTKAIRAQSDKLGIVGVLKNPEQYAEFYKLGGNVATLGKLETTPNNVRLAESAEGRKRHPFWVLANDAEVQDVFNACNGLVGAKGMIMRDPALGQEALRRRAAPGPACAACAPD